MSSNIVLYTSAWLRSHPAHVGNSVLIPLRPGKKQPLVSHKLPGQWDWSTFDAFSWLRAPWDLGDDAGHVHGLLPDIPESLLSKVCSRRPARRHAKSGPAIGSCCRLLDSSSADLSPPDAAPLLTPPSPIHMLVNMLAPSRAGEYVSWMRVGWCLHNIDADRMLPLWIAFSKQCMDRFVPGECERLWVSMRDEGYTEASLHMWAKMDSPSEYAIFMHQTVESCNGTHAEIADVAFRLLRDRYVFCNTRLWFYFDGSLWKQDKEALRIRHELSSTIRTAFLQTAHRLLKIPVSDPSSDPSSDPGSSFFTLKEATALFRSCDFYDHKPRTFKVTLQNLLGVVCHEQKKINGVNCTNVFMGFRLRWNDEEQ
eukprot:gene13459-19319_t